MKRLLYSSFFFLLFFAACNNNKQEEIVAAENDLDAARNFIRAALDGEYDKARNYMLKDSLNVQLLNTFEDNYKSSMSRNDKQSYKESSIRIPGVRKVDDSTSIVSYSNSYKNQVDSLKVVRVNDQWLVDFKYSFSSKPEDDN